MTAMTTAPVVSLVSAVLAQAPRAPAPQCETFDLGCKATAAVGSVFDGLVATIAKGAADLIVATATWWVQTDSVNPQDSAVIAAQDATRPVIVIMLVGSVLVQAIRMVLSRKAEPLVLVATGLLRFAVVSALGLTTLQLALRAGDDLAAQLLHGAANNFALYMLDALTAPPTTNTFVLLLVAVLAAILSLVQWLLMALRQAGLLVLAAMLPLAASGSLTRSTRGWLDRLIPWLLAIAVYKPAAAFIYYLGFSYLSSPSSTTPGDTSTLISGVMVLLLAIIAMPMLLKFFSWTGTQIGGNSGGGSGFLGAAGAAALAQGAGRSPAVQRAADTDTSGPGSIPTHSNPSPPPPSGGAPTTSAGGAQTSTTGAAGAAGAAGAVVAAGGAATRAGGHALGGDPPPDDTTTDESTGGQS